MDLDKELAADWEAQLDAEIAEIRDLITDIDANDQMEAGIHISPKDEAIERARARQVLKNLQHEQQFVDAGVPKNRLPGVKQRMEQVLPSLKGDNGEIIGPFVYRDANGNQVRAYTEEYISDLTGQKEIRPFYNPETGQPLTTTFGDARIHNIPGLEPDVRWQDPIPDRYKAGKVLRGAQVGPRASELVSKHTAWLAGQTDLRDAAKVDIEDFEYARSLQEVEDLSKQVQDVDFVDGKGRRIDAEVIMDHQRKKGIDGAAQLRTKVKPHDNLGKGGVPAEIKTRMQLGNETFDQAMKSLEGDITDPSKLFATPGPYDGGKIDKYDSAIHLTFEPTVNADSTRKDQPAYLRDKVTQPPRAATTTDYSVTKAHIDKGDMWATWNGRRDYNPDNSFKIDLKMTKDHPAVTDISGKGLVPQIMEKPTFTRKPDASTWDQDEAKLAKTKAQAALKADAPESVTPAVVNTDTDVPSAVVEPEKPALQQKPQRPVTATVAPEPPAPRKPVGQPVGPNSPGAVRPYERPRPTATPPRRKPEIISRATARPNPMQRPGERGFVITPGARSTAVSRVRPRLKGPSTITKITKAAPVADVAIEGGLSYLTGETDRLDHAAWKGVTSLIPDSGAAGGNTIDIGGKLYTHDKETNMITPMGGGQTKGLAYKDGKPVAVEYGSVKGRTSMVDDVVTPIVETGKAIKDTAVRRAKEWTKPKPAAPTNQRVMAVLNGKEGYMLKGDSSSFRMANWSDAQRKKYYGK